MRRIVVRVLLFVILAALPGGAAGEVESRRRSEPGSLATLGITSRVTDAKLVNDWLISWRR